MSTLASAAGFTTQRQEWGTSMRSGTKLSEKRSGATFVTARRRPRHVNDTCLDLLRHIFHGGRARLRVAPSRQFRQCLLLVASLWFYASWKPVYLLVLATPIL